MVLWIPGTADRADVRADKYFSSKENYNAPGAMPVRGAVTITPSAIAQAILEGYHNGIGVVAAVTFDASKVTNDTTIAGTRGTMPMHDGHTPGVQYTVWAGDRFFIMPPAGNYNGVSSWVTAAIPGLTAANLRSGVKVGDLEGALVEGRRSAEGTFVHGSGQTATVTGLGFTPSTVEIAWTEDQHTFRIGRSYGAWYASQVTGNATQQYYINFANSTVFSGGFTSDMLYGNGRLITWRATE